MKKVAVGIVGVGHLGLAHAKKYSAIEEAELVGFWDTDPLVRENMETELEMKSAGSLDELLEKVEAVSIVVPTTGHTSIALAAAEKGVHLFVEKPIASTLKEADDIINAAARHGVKLQVGHIERFNPAFRLLQDEVVDPRFIESHRLAAFNPRGLDVSVVLDLMIHDIDVILKLTGSPVSRIDASGVGIVSENFDIVNARLTFENGAVANITASRISQKKMRKMRLFQKDGYISMDFISGETEIFSIEDAGTHFADTDIMPILDLSHQDIHKIVGYRKIRNDGRDSLELELRSFIDAIQNNTAPPVTGEEARTALAVALEIIDKTTGN
ncbi:Gfo/Idh/MocA family protein [candidate division KSB1 bacterium]